MTFQIQQHHIDEAQRNRKKADYVSARDCPAGLALQQAFNTKEVSVGGAYITVNGVLHKTPNRLYREVILPFENKDKENPPKPGQHELEETVCPHWPPRYEPDFAI